MEFVSDHSLCPKPEPGPAESDVIEKDCFMKFCAPGEVRWNFDIELTFKSKIIFRHPKVHGVSGANALVVYPVVNQEGHKYKNLNNQLYYF